MKFPYRVQINRDIYPANTEIPDELLGGTSKDAKTTETVDEPKDVDKVDDVKAEMPESNAEESDKEEHNYTRTEVNRMTTASLHELAKELGIEGEADKSGAQLKVDIINQLGL